MAEAEVHAFPGAQITSDRRAEFVAHTASTFDRYVRDMGCEPDAMVLVMGGLKQTARCAWIVKGDTVGGQTTMLAFAQAVLIKEFSNPDGPGN